MKEKVKENFSKAVKEYNKYALIQQQAGKRLLKKLSLLDKNLLILDLGAGTGSLLKEFKNVVALDISFSMCKSCKEKGLLPIVGDGDFLPFKEKVFDVVFSNFALQWMNLGKVTHEIKQVLKNNGFAFISIPVEGSLSQLFSAWNRAHLEVFGEEDFLFRFPTEKEVIETFNKAGFKILEFERRSFSVWFNSPKEALRCVNKIGAKNPFRTSKVSKKLVSKFYKLYEIEGKFLLNYNVFFSIFKI
ncbi:Methyltransferase type 11 [Desulfurobacterium thermolithotrophum DSM 11699]|uniref:Methyltransferase type 11 n=1 Tax=Desulfurobacterium thermolithotrophum (strain DSM 11699 / BSA) TaxID=868864 RepID=F0S076_DESTD|nr:methyltransferase domain-containing protein [Desulfurobacterium thermolithotrophum]ADY73755.1 Methyltransferase type 11 [Desulfurobacterium thermolithotrophum DSM 11699]